MSLCKIIFICTISLIISEGVIEETTAALDEITNDDFTESSKFYKKKLLNHNEVIFVPNRLRHMVYPESPTPFIPTHEGRRYRKIFNLIKKTSRGFNDLTKSETVVRRNDENMEQPPIMTLNLSKNTNINTTFPTINPFKVKYVFTDIKGDGNVDELVCTPSSKSCDKSSNIEKGTEHFMVKMYRPKSEEVYKDDDKEVPFIRIEESVSPPRFKKFHLRNLTFKSNSMDQEGIDEEPSKLPVVESNVPNYLIEKIHNEYKMKKKNKMNGEDSKEGFLQFLNRIYEKKGVVELDDSGSSREQTTDCTNGVKTKLNKICGTDHIIYEVAPTIIKLDKDYNKDFNPNDYKIDKIEEMKAMLAEQGFGKKVEDVQIIPNGDLLDASKIKKRKFHKKLCHKKNYEHRLNSAYDSITPFLNCDSNKVKSINIQDIVTESNQLTKYTLKQNRQYKGCKRKNKKNHYKFNNDNAGQNPLLLAECNKCDKFDTTMSSDDVISSSNNIPQGTGNNDQIFFKKLKNDLTGNYKKDQQEKRDQFTASFDNNLQYNKIQDTKIQDNNLQDYRLFRNFDQNNLQSSNKLMDSSKLFDYYKEENSNDHLIPAKKNCNELYEIYAVSKYPQCLRPTETMNEQIYDSKGAFEDIENTFKNSADNFGNNSTNYQSNTNYADNTYNGNIENAYKYGPNNINKFKFKNIHKNIFKNYYKYPNNFNTHKDLLDFGHSTIKNSVDNSYKNSYRCSEDHSKKNISLQNFPDISNSTYESCNKTSSTINNSNLTESKSAENNNPNNTNNIYSGVYKSPVDKFYKNPVLNCKRPTEYSKNLADVYRISGANFQKAQEVNLKNQENDEMETQLYIARKTLAQKAEEIAELEKSTLLDKQFIIHLMSELLFTLQHVKNLGDSEENKDNSSGIVLEKALHEINLLTNSIVEVEKLARYFETISESASDAREDMDISLGTTIARVAALKQKLAEETKSLVELQKKLQDICKKKRKHRKFRLFAWRKD